MHADMRGAIERRSRRQRITVHAIELAAEFVLDQREHLVEPEAVDDVFKTRLGAVGPVAVIDEYAHDGVRHLGRIDRLDHHAGRSREVFVPGDTAEEETEPYPGGDLGSWLHLDGLEADVIGVLQHRNDAPAVEPDVELAR
jgi:hypothetical protein